MIKTIAFIHHKYPSGGGERVTSQIASYLNNQGYRVFVFVKVRDNAKMLASDIKAINFLDLPVSDNINAPENREFVISAIKNNSIDLFVDPSVGVNFLGDIKERTSCKILYMLHSTPLWEVILKKIRGSASAKRSFFKFIEWWCFRYPKYKLFNGISKKYIRRYKSVYNCVDCYGVLCKSDAETIAKIVGVNLLSSKIRVLTNPAYRDQLPNLNKQKRVIYVGRLELADKRVDRLIDIWSSLCGEFPDWELIIVGDGPHRSDLERLVEKDSISGVKFVGYTRDVVSYLQQASIVCLTSNFEGWPLALVEAQSYGVVPISYDCSAGIREIVGENGEYGLLVTPYDKGEYVHKLRSLMLDDELRGQMSIRSLKRSEDFSVESVGKYWIDLIRSLEK
ncbi:MAG: glycosyltransferase [Bacteroidales bacterium]